jgi:hypothetical protein
VIWVLLVSTNKNPKILGWWRFRQIRFFIFWMVSRGPRLRRVHILNIVQPTELVDFTQV